MYTHTCTHAHIDLNVFYFYSDYKEVEKLNFQGKIENLHQKKAFLVQWGFSIRGAKIIFPLVKTGESLIWWWHTILGKCQLALNLRVGACKELHKYVTVWYPSVLPLPRLCLEAGEGGWVEDILKEDVWEWWLLEHVLYKDKSMERDGVPITQPNRVFSFQYQFLLLSVLPHNAQCPSHPLDSSEGDCLY